VNKTYEDGTECTETSAQKIQTPGNNPKERIQHSQQGEVLKSSSFRGDEREVSYHHHHHHHYHHHKPVFWRAE
jgi:hypothetical protein